MEQRQHRPPQHILACLSSPRRPMQRSCIPLPRWRGHLAACSQHCMSARRRMPAFRRQIKPVSRRISAWQSRKGQRSQKHMARMMPDQIAEFARVSGITKDRAGQHQWCGPGWAAEAHPDRAADPHSPGGGDLYHPGRRPAGPVSGRAQPLFSQAVAPTRGIWWSPQRCWRR